MANETKPPEWIAEAVDALPPSTYIMRRDSMIDHFEEAWKEAKDKEPPPPPCPECERLKDHAAALYRALLEAATLADAHNGDESPSDIPESGKTWTSTAGRLIRENAAALKAMADTVRPAVIDRLTKERDAALKALRSLTPGGSEYQTPEECAAFVRTSRDDVMRVLKDFKAQRDAALAERDEARAWIRKASGWPIAHEMFCAKMRETAPARCSCGLDEFLAGGESAKKAAMEPLDAALATAQARDEEAKRLRERLVDARWFVERCAQSTDPYLSGVGKDGLARIDAALGSPR